MLEAALYLLHSPLLQVYVYIVPPIPPFSLLYPIGMRTYLQWPSKPLLSSSMTCFSLQLPIVNNFTAIESVGMFYWELIAALHVEEQWGEQLILQQQIPTLRSACLHLDLDASVLHLDESLESIDRPEVEQLFQLFRTNEPGLSIPGKYSQLRRSLQRYKAEEPLMAHCLYILHFKR